MAQESWTSFCINKKFRVIVSSTPNIPGAHDLLQYQKGGKSSIVLDDLW